MPVIISRLLKGKPTHLQYLRYLNLLIFSEKSPQKYILFIYHQIFLKKNIRKFNAKKIINKFIGIYTTFINTKKYSFYIEISIL